jgi:voltage-gated potassium channel
MPVDRPAETTPGGALAGSAGGRPKRRFTQLLVLLLCMVVLAPLLDEAFDLLLLDDVFLTAIFISAAYSFSRNKRLLGVLIALALPALLATWAGPHLHARWPAVLGGVCDVAFSATLTVAVLVHIFRERDVSGDVIAGAIVAYLFMALMWSQIYFVLEALRPGSFTLPAGANAAAQQSLLRYFSLVTITTVGYGDITPTTTVARAFANLEAVVGQLYLVIQVAWLVGMHVSMKSK